ncbi:MAG: tRNA pseudouridine(55) synthase TruB, partial [Granulosicoccaceae bacterium]
MSRRNRRGRALDGILLVDKPLGVSSHGAVQWCRRVFGASKAGHTGSLDPKASGMLPICFGEGTKFGVGELLAADKQYIAEATLGARSTTGDLEGELFEQRAIPENLDQLLPAAMAQFRGQIEQVPPMHSALKHEGLPLYKLARAGQTVERKTRQVRIDSLDVVEQRGNTLKLRVACSKGTYIRTLVEDLGEALGCGAHTTGLHREWVAPFQGLQMHDPEMLEELGKKAAGKVKPELDALLLPVDVPLQHLPEWRLKNDDEMGVFWFGNPVSAPGLEDLESVR